MDRTDRGNRFRIWRQNAGLSQNDVADAVACNRAAVAAWESGASMPTRPKWGILAELYAIPKSEIGALRSKHNYPVQSTCNRCGYAHICHILGRDGLCMLCEEPEEAHISAMRKSGTLEAFRRFQLEYQRQNGGQRE